MKKIKTINKLLSSLTLLSPLSEVGFNNQYQNVQSIISENTKNYLNAVEPSQEQMGDVKVNVETDTESGYRKITGYVEDSGSGALVISNDIDEIGADAFHSGANITSVDFSNATRLKIIAGSVFYKHKELTGNIVIPSSVTSIGTDAFNETDITSLDLSQATSLTSIGNYAFANCHYVKNFVSTPESNKNFSLVTNLGPNAKVLVSGTDSIWKDNSFLAGSLAFGDIVISSNISTISAYAFYASNISSLDLSSATTLNSIGYCAFGACLNLTGDLVIPSSITNIDTYAFSSIEGLDNFYFLSEFPPVFEDLWQPKLIKGKVYVPSQAAKEKYLKAQYFSFGENQVEIGLPPEPTPTPEPSKSNIPLILGLILGLGIPTILAVGFGVWYLTKKKKITVKI